MVLYHKASKTKSKGTGGLKRSMRDKIKGHYGGFFARAKINKAATEEEWVVKESKGGSTKVAARTVIFANVAMPDGRVKRAKLDTVSSTPDNRIYARENILTRGAIVISDVGKIRITSRPGQDGNVNAVLVEAGTGTHAAPAVSQAPKAEKPKAAKAEKAAQPAKA